MSEELRKCPICELNYRPNSHRFIDPRLCPHHEDSVWRNKYDALVAERDKLQAKLEAAKEALKEIVDYAQFDPDNDEYPVEVARKVWKQLEAE